MHQPRDIDEGAVVGLLLSAFAQGIFPMGEASGAVRFYTADPRGIMPIRPEDGFHVPRSVDRDIRRNRFVITADVAFTQVMRACATPRSPEDAPWINDQLVKWYDALHQRGHAHSLEAWKIHPDTRQLVLVGGIYGVSLGHAFIGESMFCTPRPRIDITHAHPLDGTGASKVVLVLLARHLAACGYDLFDIQMVTGHTGRFGAREISAEDYMALLTPAAAKPDAWKPFQAP